MTTPADPASKPPSPRTRVRRAPTRGHYDEATLHAILDEGLVAHVAFVTEHGPVVVPMAYARDGARLLLHAARASRFGDALGSGQGICVTVTLLDGVVLARSAFHHSMNYRSVVIFGVPERIDDPEAKRLGLDALVDHVVPGRSARVRPASEAESNGTVLFALPLLEASAKIRTGPPKEDPEDLVFPAFAGVIPLTQMPGALVAEPDLDPLTQTPAPEEVHFLRARPDRAAPA